MQPVLPDLFAEAAKTGRGVRFINSGVHSEYIPWTQFLEESKATAAVLQAKGIKPGDSIATVATTSRELVTALQAAWLCGAANVVLPLPMRMKSIEDFIAQTRGRISAADSKLILIGDDLAPYVQFQPEDAPAMTLGDLADKAKSMSAVEFNAPTIDPDSLAILQFTSGSTSEPKGVMLSHRQLAANLAAIRQAANVDVQTDTIVSWLPLYHDMGLVGLMLTSMTTGIDLVIAPPQDFMGRPANWMEWIAQYKGTATAGPNFSYVLATKGLKRGEALDLSSLRIALNGAEPVDAVSVQQFVDAGARHGMDPGAVFPAFGMAEVCIAGTFPPPGRGVVVDYVDGSRLTSEQIAAPVAPDAEGARAMTLLGKAVPGLEIRIVDTETGNTMQDREVGELEIRGNSVTSGYYKRPDATAETFHDEWLKTGDLGYMVDGELVVCGRIKDVIIVGGRNVYPQDVENAVNDVDGVRPGNVAAFGTQGKRGHEAIVVVAEVKTNDPTNYNPDKVVREIKSRVFDAVGLHAEDVVLINPSSLPKTSSGKLQRSAAKQLYVTGELELAPASGVSEATPSIVLPAADIESPNSMTL